ncbi:MAG: hypothetical protein JRJ82_19735, partial [Deltaproteobacteria bacterium]|nr:hypothetical protein [Deltaproteobacteria bacterium]
MKIKQFAVLGTILTFILLCQPFTANAVVDWTKDANNPVYEPGDGQGNWDDGWVERPMVVKEGANSYTMWYMARGSSGTTTFIGRVTSSDGVNWGSGVSVFGPSASGWDSQNVLDGWIIKGASGASPYQMWYAGNDVPDDDEVNLQIGYACSNDGINWVRGHSGVTDPVLEFGSGVSDWDRDCVCGHTVLYDSSATTPYKMWYVGYNDAEDIMGIGYAESQDGVNWTKHGNAVISPGNQGAWDSDEIFAPTVIKEESIYRIWYDGDAGNDVVNKIGYAYSLDGINWRKYDGNPVIMEGDTATDDFDENAAMDSMVLKDGNTYKMWYVGDSNCDPGPCDTAIGYATSQAWQGTDLDIEDIMVASVFTPWGGPSGTTMIMVGCWPYGPGPLDVNELKVEGPGGFSYTFPDSDTMSWMGLPIVGHGEAKDPVPTGTYTFYLKANNGQNDSQTVDLTGTPFSDYLREGGGNLDRDIKVDATIYGNESYISATTPTFRWKPYVGTTGYYYRVRVTDWKNMAYWYVSGWDEGTNTSGGYMSAQPSEGILKSNTPYRWQVEVSDTNVIWAGHNMAQSTRYDFYTGAKSGTADFLNDTYGKAWFRSTRSFRDGDQANFGAFVHKLAPWDIELDSPNQFRVDIGGVTPFYDFNPDNNAFTPDPFPFMYYGGAQGFPVDGTYNFYVYEDGTGNNETANIGFSGVTDVPQVTKDEMR